MKNVNIPIGHLYNIKNELVNYNKNVKLNNIIEKNEEYLNKQVGGFLDILFKSSKQNTEDLLNKCTTQGNCGTEEYAKIFAYLNYNITLLAAQFSSSELDKLKLQLDEMKNLLTIK